MDKLILKIDGMHCRGCSERLTKILNQKKNIKKAEVNFETKKATIEFTKISKIEIEKYIEEAGFKIVGE